MWNNNSYQNQNRETNLNSNLMASATPDSLLTAVAWNKSITLRIAKAIGKRSDGSTEYETDKARILSTCITYDNAVVLYEGYVNILKPAMDINEPKSISAVIQGKDGRPKVITIGYTPDSGSYLSIVTQINENGVATEDNVITHKFNRRELREDYNFITGSSAEVTEVETDLAKLMDLMHHMILLTPMVSHSIRYDKAERERYANNRNVGNYAQYGGPQAYQQFTQNMPMQAPIPQQTFSPSDMEETLPFN